MSAKIIDGKETARKLRETIKTQVENLKAKGFTPGLAVVLVGNDPASQVYVGHKEKACKEVGFHSEVYRLPETTSQEELLKLIDNLNNDKNIHGILVQLPLPGHLNEKEVINKISPVKDVDGFHPLSAGALFVGEKSLVPCTPKGCIHLIKETGFDLQGKKAVVVGRSNIVGKPVAILLLNENATVTICHSRTKNLKAELLEADVVVAAVGKPNFITGDMIKPGAVVIDVGINRLDNGKLVGDVEFETAKEKAGWITPVPGGVGPMTIAMLLQNTLEAAQS
ncbi:MAG: methylenetetrahydrofolate dehydrogenase / methenyltetrahydrofolate cyclohydrolase [Clostridia bacterium]|jgi:methylenetetrahydrofolate dehydrogenase (NADP+)/methenyltetrahydrofolate cyclohydrolase|nr:methylenetetrahydrofolate dehydrogenase / methenyltetrahydrofolate cyclohydrolase [Clostridia bacterium]MDN5322194.1 methylenetetrahydrofolate dehydrogenase / methenyltetrahydrofolate cyclohydrolase [Clostridia bacterium]